MKIDTQVVLNKSYRKIILKMSWLSWKYADVSKKLENKKNRSFIQTALTFDLKKIFQLCLDSLKDKRIIFNINSCFYIGINILFGIARQK